MPAVTGGGRQPTADMTISGRRFVHFGIWQHSFRCLFQAQIPAATRPPSVRTNHFLRRAGCAGKSLAPFGGFARGGNNISNDLAQVIMPISEPKTRA